MADIEWLDEPEDHDFSAAYDYLTLLFRPTEAGRFATGLRGAMTVARKAKDLLRASELPLLPKSNPHVKKDIQKDALSPVLLVVSGGKLVVADGYHRICAARHIDEDAEVRCRILWDL